MSIAELDPRSALVVIDLQEGVRPMPTNTPMSVVFANAAKLARAFREHGLPVVLVNVKAKEGRRKRRVDVERPRSTPPANAADLVPELDVQPSDIRVTKHTWSAFFETGLDEILAAAGVTEVVLAGVATSVGVEATARAAYERAYNVTFAQDAMADREQIAHDYSVSRVFPRIGQVATTAEILAILGLTPVAPAG